MSRPSLLFTGGLQALRTASLQSGVPMAVILMLTCYCLLKALRIDASKGSGLPEARELQERTLRRDGTGSRQQSLSTD